jgi:cyclopropane fatty-acyl-phospholipid synthase-like methyltransferase
MSMLPASPDLRRSHPSSQRNREPIGAVLKKHLVSGCRVLEIAAGTGEQAVYLSHQLNASEWWPSDIAPSSLQSVDAWRLHEQNTAMRPAFLLDISRPADEISAELKSQGAMPPLFDAVVCINMIHISAWQVAEGLLRAAGQLLRRGGILFLYGPYRRDGKHTSASNAEFDADLRSRNPDWGIRDLEEVCDLALLSGLRCIDVVAMPANNFSVILQKSSD